MISNIYSTAYSSEARPYIFVTYPMAVVSVTIVISRYHLLCLTFVIDIIGPLNLYLKSLTDE